MKNETRIGGQASQFPATRWSAIIAAGSANDRERTKGLQTIVQAYWRPVYKTIRIKWGKSNEDAKDLTQAFFTTAIEKDFFTAFDSSKAKFRTYLRTCLNGFLANEHKASRRQKRGGQYKIDSLDFLAAEKELKSHEPADDSTPDDFFDREWVRALYSITIESLQAELTSKNKAVYFHIFERYDLAHDEKPTYDMLANEFDLPITKVTNYLAAARREFRNILLEKLRNVTMSEQEFQQEARSLLGISP